MIDALPLLLGDDGYQISRSVRLRSSATAFFNRTPGSASNRRTWTWSGWVKRGRLTASSASSEEQHIFTAGSSTTSDATYFRVFFDGIQRDCLSVGAYNTVFRVSTATFRDPSAWYHIVVAFDSTQATAQNRLRVYVNGVEITAFQVNNAVALNTDYGVNATNAHEIGRESAVTRAFDGYLTEVNFIDGQALTPSSFGETDVITGVWKPRRYTGTYGTNGFYLNFSDPSAATAAAIGRDYSGNGNNWTPNNISVSAGATYDSMIDVPTPWADGGNGRGNYAVLNPLEGQGAFISNGNLTISSADNSYRVVNSTIEVTSGKWYAEYNIASRTFDTAVSVLNRTTNVAYYYLSNSGSKWDTSASQTGYGATYTSGDIIGVAFDADTRTLTFYKNGVSQGVAFSGMPVGSYVFSGYTAGAGSNWSANFGQRPFAYTPPSGFRALNTQNLPEPTIVRGNRFFDVSTWTGNGTSQSIVNSGAMQPDLMWIKSRSVNGYFNALLDSARGITRTLFSNSTEAESTLTTRITAINSNGFTVGSSGDVNDNMQTFVGWQWREGATQGFDIVTFNSGPAGSITVNHNLGVAPRMIIAKDRTASPTNWIVYHASVISNVNTYLQLNGTAALQTAANIWGTTLPTSTLFGFNSGVSVGTNSNCVAYLFSEVAGFSRFGSYTGNGNNDGPFVFTGFRPRFIMVKRTDTTGNWHIVDTARTPTNIAGQFLQPNLSAAEATASIEDILSNGFKLRSSDADFNLNGATYIFAAFAESPFKVALAR